MSTEPKFRIAVEGDAELLLDFMRAYYAFDGHGFDREKARVALLALLRNPEYGRAWLILDDTDAVGYVVICFGYSLEWLGRDAFVDEFYLREDYRNRGWGKKTMYFVEQSAQELGIRALHLEVMEGNAVAMHIYKNSGSSDIQASSYRSGSRKTSRNLRLRSGNRLLVDPNHNSGMLFPAKCSPL